MSMLYCLYGVVFPDLVVDCVLVVVLWLPCLNAFVLACVIACDCLFVFSICIVLWFWCFRIVMCSCISG